MLTILAAGYLAYDTQTFRSLFRVSEPKKTGYVFYVRTAVVGLLLFYAANLFIGIMAAYTGETNSWVMNVRVAPLILLIIFIIWSALSVLIHWCCSKESDFEDAFRIIKLEGRELDIFIYERVKHAEMSMVTLENNKVYVGWILESRHSEGASSWMRMVPYSSGYRDASGQVKFTVSYMEQRDILQSLDSKNTENGQIISQQTIPSKMRRAVLKFCGLSAPGINLISDKMKISIPVNKIMSLQPFNPEIYEQLYAAWNESEGRE